MWAELSKKPSFDAYLEMASEQMDAWRYGGGTAYAQGKALYESIPWPFGQGVSPHAEPYVSRRRMDELIDENRKLKEGVDRLARGAAEQTVAQIIPLKEENARLEAELAKLKATQFEPGKRPYAPSAMYEGAISALNAENARLRKALEDPKVPPVFQRRVDELTAENVKLQAELAKLRTSGGPPKWPRSHVDERGEPVVNSVWQRDAAPFGVVQMAGEPGSTERFVIYSRIGGPGTALVVTLGEFLDGRFSPILA